MSDVPSLTFVDPDEAASRFRVVLWAAPGEGKSVGAASAPGPILVVSGDRPGAYRFARRHHADKDIREVRFVNSQTLADVYTYLKGEGQDVRTVVIDPFGPIYDKLAEEFPTAKGETNWQGLNKKIKGFLYSLRALDVHVVLVAHEKLNDGEGRLYPALGGPALINTVLAESDIVAHVERQEGAKGEPPQYVAQLAPTGALVCKESTGVLGDRRVLDLAEWFELAGPDTSDLPWDDEAVVEEIKAELDAVEEDPDAPGGQFDMDDARAEAA